LAEDGELLGRVEKASINKSKITGWDGSVIQQLIKSIGFQRKKRNSSVPQIGTWASVVVGTRYDMGAQGLQSEEVQGVTWRHLSRRDQSHMVSRGIQGDAV
jgi:hypothetical protein